MALLNLSDVTKSLTKLIEVAVGASSEYRKQTVKPTVSPQPPDLLKGNQGSKILGFYLYHVSEDAHFKNFPAPGSDAPPVRYTPMGLILHYQLTAHAGEGDGGTTEEQRMMGLAIKALHDYPLIDDTTEIIDAKNQTVKILDYANLAGDGNRLRIMLQPLPHNEAVSYWTAGNTPLRLAAYYEVSVVLLEPEEIKSRAGRVLTYDVYSFIQGAPRLSTSWNTLSFTLPGESVPREVVLQPAEITYNQVVTFKGTNLTAKETALLLNNPRWEAAVEVDLNWAVLAKPEEVNAKVQQEIIRPLLTPVTILPGIYSAQVKVIDERVASDGSFRRFEKLSNFTPFTITPYVEPLGTPSAAGVLGVQGAIFWDADLSPNVQVFISEKRLTTGTYDNLNRGEFAVKDKDANNMQIRLPEGLASGEYVPFRLVINGAESQPQWVKVP
jgi:hypothetical protein